MERTLIVVSKKWHEPFVRVDVTGVGIAVSMTMDDFVEAVRQETGHDVRDGAERIIAYMKAETRKAL